VRYRGLRIPAIAGRQLRPSLIPCRSQGKARPLSSLKFLNSDTAAVLAQSEEIKARNIKLFKV
jgi:hypothetical protein